MQGSQLAIESGHRFEHRLVILESLYGLKIVGSGEGSVLILDPAKFIHKSNTPWHVVRIVFMPNAKPAKISPFVMGLAWQATCLIPEQLSRKLFASVRKYASEYKGQRPVPIHPMDPPVSIIGDSSAFGPTVSSLEVSSLGTPAVKTKKGHGARFIAFLSKLVPKNFLRYAFRVMEEIAFVYEESHQK